MTVNGWKSLERPGNAWKWLEGLKIIAGMVNMTYLLEKPVMPTPPLPTHLVMHYTF